MQLTATPSRPRVLHVTQPVDGGVARVVRDLTEAQLTAGMRISVACPPDGPLAGSLRRIGCDVLPWEATRSPGPGIAREVRGLARLVAQVRPTLVHAHSAKAGLVARLAVRGRVPTVFQPHAWSFEAVDGATARLALAWERRGARWASRVVCVSEAERATGERAGITARWDVIPNGVDLTRFVPAPEPREATADPLVVCVGRICRQKGQDVLVRAWPLVQERFPRARLVLVGDGPDVPALRRQATASVRFVGADDPVPWYRQADLVVLPSRWEGMALAPLEAMACGRPVVVTDVDGARESLPAGLASDCLVPPDDPAALARALTGLLRDPHRLGALGGLALQHARTHHDVRRTADAVADVYRELLGVEPTECREPINT
ncbi:glycosyl transferase family 1 [Streptomyces sp. CB01635]|uniref:glycosyltransferase n=1 Tax=unclassified Streptomyces TaxID=2593676 RepID=UPI000C27E167|nr:glycosyltransferase [Streptomyces sp. CB01635]PJN08318.1 glycosyl transferase family 1 [Streptomyces sp. CB01635]